MATNASRAMLPLHSLLNPVSPRYRAPESHRSSPTLSSSSVLSSNDAPRVVTDGPFASKRRLSRSANTMGKAKPQGPINFSPFEDIDDGSFRELSRFQVTPFGRILQCCEHIPYNSSKKDFFEKTGRDSIEVFKYDFKLPGEETSYTVMWDYNVGLVRMTPFFKCLGYPKTKPSQMLDKNPGLRDICPSVTGGAVSAQGYWMPYRCAKAVCATFCYRIAGALIPLFGPYFPSECTPPDSPFYQEMIIYQQTIIEATKEVEIFRSAHKGRLARALDVVTGHSRLERYAFRTKNERDEAASHRLHSRPPSFWTPINSTDNNRPMAISAPSSGYGMREFGSPTRNIRNETFTDGSSQEYEPFQHNNPPIPMVPSTIESHPPGIFTEKWRPKRRRRVQNASTLALSITAPTMDLHQNNERKKPLQELDHLKAAAVLVSIQKDTQAMDRRGAVTIYSSDEDSSSGGLHQKKRPKAHSF